jgi:hypothetical protein
MEKKQRNITCLVLILIFSSFQLYNMYIEAYPPEDPDASRPLHIRVTLKHGNQISPMSTIESEIILESDMEIYDNIILYNKGNEDSNIVYIGTSLKTITYKFRFHYAFQINSTGTIALNQIPIEKNPLNDWGIYEGTETWWFRLPTSNETVECILTIELGPRQ